MDERIAVDLRIHFGKPCIKGTRDVLKLVREGLSFEAIVRDYYPDPARDDIAPASSMP